MAYKCKVFLSSCCYGPAASPFEFLNHLFTAFNSSTRTLVAKTRTLFLISGILQMIFLASVLAASVNDTPIGSMTLALCVNCGDAYSQYSSACPHSQTSYISFTFSFSADLHSVVLQPWKFVSTGSYCQALLNVRSS